MRCELQLPPGKSPAVETDPLRAQRPPTHSSEPLTFIVSDTVDPQDGAAASCGHVQKGLDNFNFEDSIFLPKVQHTDYFTLLCVRKREYTINICISNLLHLTKKREKYNNLTPIFPY